MLEEVWPKAVENIVEIAAIDPVNKITISDTDSILATLQPHPGLVRFMPISELSSL